MSLLDGNVTIPSNAVLSLPGFVLDSLKRNFFSYPRGKRNLDTISDLLFSIII